MLEGRSSPGELHCRIMSSHDTRKWESKSSEDGSEAPTASQAGNGNVCSDHFFPEQILEKKKKVHQLGGAGAVLEDGWINFDCPLRQLELHWRCYEAEGNGSSTADQSWLLMELTQVSNQIEHFERDNIYRKVLCPISEQNNMLFGQLFKQNTAGRL